MRADERELRQGRSAVEPELAEWRLWVPTYFGRANCIRGVDGEDFDNPHVQVLVHQAEGVRIVLGSHDYEDMNAPDIQIERRPNGWAIFLHPVGGSDPSGYVYFLDDGRSFLLKENEWATDAIVVLDSKEEPLEVDDVGAAKHLRCARCGKTEARDGDWYSNLCPACADKTDGTWSCRRCGRSGDFEAMGGAGEADPVCCGSACERIDVE
jgi:hypothetical protein